MRHFAWLLAVVPAFVWACSSSTSVVAITPDGGDAAVTDGGSGDGATGGTQCSKARDELLVPISKASAGTVSTISDSNGVKQLYIDAVAGGSGGASKTAHTYVNLETGTKVVLDDVSAYASTDWDLSFRRVLIWTNSGDAGKGGGGAVGLVKAFASVNASDADAAEIASERFFDASCEAQKDATGAPFTTFSSPAPYGWYDYDQATMIPTPRPDVTYVVRGATGRRYKVGILSYSGTADGGTGTTTGAFVIQVSAL